MPHGINLRQIEAFKALIEHGTVSRAAEVLSITQPAASRLLMHLENDTGLKLFDRHKGRLIATAQGLRLYDEIDRVFAGVRQVETAIAVIRREQQGRLDIGIVPALNGDFIQQATMEFLKRNPNVNCSIQSRSSHWIAESVVARKFDVGLFSARIDNPYIVIEPLLEHPLVCILPLDHPLTQLDVIRPEDLRGIAFISFGTDFHTGQTVERIFEKYKVDANIVLTTNTAATACRFVGAGLGISLVHPLFIEGMEDRLAVRRFEPVTPFDFLLCYARDARNSHLISEFVKETKALATRLSEEWTKRWS